MARYPITQVVTFEEDRVEANLRHLTQNSMKRAGFWTWACTTGLVGPEGPVKDTRDPERALDVGPLTRLLAARYAETVPDRLDRG